MARPFYSAPVKHRPDFPLLPGQVRLPPPHVLTGPPPPPPPPGFHSDKPWMTPQLVAEIRRRNFLQTGAVRSGAEQDRAAAEQQRQLVNRLVNDAKERFCLAHPERTDEILASDRRGRPFHCGSCDRNYGTQQQLDEHCREHVRCGLDDCPFTAHPRVVEKHVTMQHQTGLAKVIMALNTPEAIARWREQRRANFCRPESAAKRQQQQAERAARGIRMGGGRGRFPPPQERAGRGRGRGVRGGFRGGPAQWRGRGGRGARARPPEPQPLESDSDGETPTGLPTFAGILAEPVPVGGRSDAGSEPEDRSDAGSDDGANGAGLTEAAPDGAVDRDAESTQVQTQNGVPNGKSEQGSGETPMEAEGATETKHPGNPDPAPSQIFTEAGRADVTTAVSKPTDPGPGSTATKAGEPTTAPAPSGYQRAAAAASPDSKVPAAGAEPSPHPGQLDAGGDRGRGGRWRGRGRRRGGAADQPPRKRRRPLTLLEKLLAADIQRERNIILQCVRHVVNEDFFDGRPLGGRQPAAVTSGSDDGRPADDGSPVPVVDPGPPAAGAPPAECAADPAAGAEQPQLQGELAVMEAQTESDQPLPRLLGGAYYDSDVITDSE